MHASLFQYRNMTFTAEYQAPVNDIFIPRLDSKTYKKKDLNHDIIVTLSPSTIYDPVFDLILSNTKISRIIAPDKYALVAKR